MPLFSLLPTKTVLGSAMVLQSIALISFTLTSVFSLQAAARFVSGFSQVIMAIFLPVWVDAFADEERKTKWMTYIMGAAPLGMITGYSMTALIVSLNINWKWAFYIHIVLLAPFIVMLFAVDKSDVEIGHTQITYEIANVESPDQRNDRTRTSEQVQQQMQQR